MRGERGVTLVELLIVSVVAAGMCLTFAAMVRMSHRSAQMQSNIMTVSHELRRGIEEICHDLAGSSANVVNIPADGVWYNAITYQVPEDTDNNGTVLDGAGAVEWSVPITVTIGGPDNNQMRRTQGAAVRVLSNGVTALQFRRQAATPQIVEVNLTVQKGANAGGFIQQAALPARVRLRN